MVNKKHHIFKYQYDINRLEKRRIIHSLMRRYIVSNIIYHNDLKVFHLYNESLSYIIKIEKHNILTQLYLGSRINELSGYGSYPPVDRAFEVNPKEIGIENRSFSMGVLPLEYSGNNSGDYREPAIIIRNHDGSTVNDFRYVKHEIVGGVADIKGLPSSYVINTDEAKTLKIYLEDTYLNHELILNYTIFRDYPIITRSAKLTNYHKKASSIRKIASMSLDLEPGNYDLLQLNGAWARERMVEREPIHTGIKKLDSKRGSSSHHQAPFIGILAKQADENKGAVLSFQLVYSGSFEMCVEKDPYENIRVQLGIQSSGFEWELQPGDSFQTPEVIINYSDSGLNGMSNNYHHFIKNHIIPRSFSRQERPILINNWEATYFNFNEEKIKALIDIASNLGIELFVLDDGWFGHRDDDYSSLGDWYEYREKLPQGLQPIAKYVHEKGMKFGLWMEPEMISEDSKLFEKHPNWLINDPERPASRGRSQYVLDMGNKEVRENIFTQITHILDGGYVDYVKWDMNRNISEAYSTLSIKNKSGEALHRYILGVYDLMDKITQRYPHILFESCSGGGGRFDLGMLQYMPQVWTSDNTDPIARLKIQYGTSMIAPISTMGAHVSASPNHQTGRETSIDFRASVAFAGVFGYELDLTQLDCEDLRKIANQVEFYKENRKIIQTGQFTRLISPFMSNCSAWSIHDDDQMLLFYFEKLNQASKALQKVKPLHLDKRRKYLVEYDNVKFEAFGDELMNIGIYIHPPLSHDFAARIFKIKGL